MDDWPKLKGVIHDIATKKGFDEDMEDLDKLLDEMLLGQL